MSETRTTIRSHVYTDAGVHFNALVRRSGYAPGQVQYHLRRLLDADELVSEEFYGQTHYFPPTYDADERAVLALLRRETTRDIVAVLLDRGPTKPATLASDLDVARSTLEYHLERLVAHDVVEKRYDASNRVTVVLAAPDVTAQLLAVVEPSIADRFVDRFARLVDEVLEPDPDR